MPRAFFAFALAISFVVVPLSAQAAPKAKLWERWVQHDAASTRTVDHSAWTDFLKTYRSMPADGVARLDYGGVSAPDRARLEAYIKLLEATPISQLNRAEQMAYWLNFYNALTVKVILDHLPVDSILKIDISPGLFANGPWRKKLVTVEGEALSLDDMEHRILRPIWKDPRIHYGVNCASIGCPNLAPVAFTPGNLEQLLTQGAIDYVNHPRGVTFDGSKLIVSSIYEWFQEDFGNSEAGVLDHLREYAKPDLRAALNGRDRYDKDEYDWALNTPGAGS